MKDDRISRAPMVRSMDDGGPDGPETIREEKHFGPEDFGDRALEKGEIRVIAQKNRAAKVKLAERLMEMGLARASVAKLLHIRPSGTSDHQTDG